MWTDLSIVLSQSTRVTYRQTYGRTEFTKTKNDRETV